MSVLHDSVLVLNRNWAAITVVTVQRAMQMLFRESAEVIAVDKVNGDDRYSNYDIESWVELSSMRELFPEEEDDVDEIRWIRTPMTEIMVPAIIRLLAYEKFPEKTVKFNRRNIFARDGGLCQYCGKKFPYKELTLDHVVPRSQGGRSSWTNIVCACVDCNRRKANRRPKQAGMLLLRKPVKPTRNPVIRVRLGDKRYSRSWRHFVDEKYWSVELTDAD